jgi:hypothetical protein
MFKLSELVTIINAVIPIYMNSKISTAIPILVSGNPIVVIEFGSRLVYN